MKALIFISLVTVLSSSQLWAQQIFHRNGTLAWNGVSAFHDNRALAWNGVSAFYENSTLAWNGISAFHDNRALAWNGTTAYYENRALAWNGVSAFYENSTLAWNGTTAYYDNGQILAQNLYTQIQGVNLNGLEISELEVSNKIKLLTKTFNNKIYVVGLKIQLSEKVAILINKENDLTTNIIQLDKDIHFETANKNVRLSVLGQNVVSQN